MPFGIDSISPDVSNGFKDIESQISAYQDYAIASQQAQQAQKNAGNSDAESAGFFSKQLDSLAKDQASFQRNIPTSYDQLINLIGKTSPKSGSTGLDTTKLLRKILLQTAIEMKPYLTKVLKDEAFKALNCSIQQTYKSIQSTKLNPIQGLSTIPANETLLVRIEDIDLFQNLKINPKSLVGKVFYEQGTSGGINQISGYRNYNNSSISGFPMNYELWERQQNPNRSFFQSYSLPYYGKSITRIFDFQFIGQGSATNETGNYIQVALLDREQGPKPTPTQTPTPSITPTPSPVPGATPTPTPTKSPLPPLIDLDTLQYSANTIIKSISDYYDSIDVIDTRAFAGTLLNLLTGVLSSPLSVGQSENQSAFTLIINRIFGLCENNEKEINVAGTAKLSPYDNINDNFFNLNEADRRNIDQFVNNSKNKIVQYVECDNLPLPVDDISIITQLTAITDSQTVQEQVETLEAILDSIPQKWEQTFPSIEFQTPFNKDVLNKIPLALSTALFAQPKNLFPLFLFKSFLENEILGFANRLIVRANRIVPNPNPAISSANTIADFSYQIIGSGVDFIRKFKKFVFGIVAKIAEKFLEVLFETLKKNLLQLIKVILADIYKKTKDRRILMLKSLLEVGEFLVETVIRYRECKSLVEAIQKILKLVNKKIPGVNPINKTAISFADGLPGFSSTRASVNVVGEMQKFGLPTGSLPDGGPNEMVFYTIATQTGWSKEDAINGVVDIGVSILTGLPIGKNR